MKRCILARGTKPLRNGLRNPKDYPFWKELEDTLCTDAYRQKVILINIEKELPLPELRAVLLEADIIITVDSFIQHYCWSIGKRCVVLFGKSDPDIFGHRENINVLKDRKYLRPDQFNTWEETSYNSEAFVTPDVVLDIIDKLLA